MTAYSFGPGRLFALINGEEVEVCSVLNATMTLNQTPEAGDRVEISRDELGVYGSISTVYDFDWLSWAAPFRPDPLPPPRGRPGLLSTTAIRPADVPAGPRDGWYGATDVFDRFALRSVARNVGKTALAARIERERLAAGRRSDFLPTPICPA